MALSWSLPFQTENQISVPSLLNSPWTTRRWPSAMPDHSPIGSTSYSISSSGFSPSSSILNTATEAAISASGLSGVST